MQTIITSQVYNVVDAVGIYRLFFPLSSSASDNLVVV